MIWEWDDDPQHTGKWVPYSQEQNSELNTALTAGTRTIYLHTLLGSYVIDLVAMTQTKAATGFKRAIRRQQVDDPAA